MDNIDIICLDAEFAENEELLELSVFDLSGREIYHEYYRPEKINEWRTDIHHITPEMVADKPHFNEISHEVQNLLDKAFAVTGFAVDNDLRVLSRSGITGLEEKRVIDVKDMYWFLKGIPQDMSPFSVPSLITCAGALGLDYGEATAHSASADTEATLECFNILVSEFRRDGNDAPISEIVDSFIEEIQKAKAKFIEDSARGVVRIYKFKEFYRLQFGRGGDEADNGVIAEVSVADRYKAEYDLKKKLKKKEVTDKRNVYKLTSKMIEEIKGYKNEYDAEQSAWCKKVLRNLSRLSL